MIVNCNKLTQQNTPFIRGIPLLQNNLGYQIQSMTSCPGHIAVHMSPEFGNVLVLLDNTPKSMWKNNEIDSLKLATVIKEAMTNKMDESPKGMTPQVSSGQQNVKFSYTDISMNNLKKLWNFQNPSVQDTLVEVPRESKQVNVSWKVLSQEPILAISDSEYKFVYYWFHQQEDVTLFFALQNNGTLWTSKFQSQTYTWETPTRTSLTNNKIHSAVWISSLKALVWIENISITIDGVVRRTGVIAYKKLLEKTNDTCRVADLVEVPKIQREITLDVVDLKESKNGVWLTTNEKIYHIDLTTSCLVNEYPTAILDARSYMFRGEKFHGVTYCNKTIHPISKQLLMVGLDGILRMVSFSQNPNILVCNEMKKISYGMEMQFMEMIKQPKKSRIELMFVNNSLLSISNGDIMVFYEPKSVKKLFQVILTSDLMDSSLDRIVSSGFDLKSFIYSKSNIYEIKIPPMHEILKSCSIAKDTTSNDLLGYAQSSLNWSINLQGVQFLLSMLIKTNREDSLKNYDQIFEILSKYLENPALLWCSTTSMIEQKALESTLDEFMSVMEQANTKSFNKFTNLNLQLYPLLKQAHGLLKHQIELIKQERIKKEQVDLLEATDIEILDYTPSEDLLIPLAKYFGVEPLLVGHPKDCQLQHMSRECAHLGKNDTMKPIPCMCFEIFCRILYRQHPNVLIEFLQLLQSSEKLDFDSFVSRSMTLLQPNDSQEGNVAFGQLLRWRRDWIECLEFYLDKKMMDQALEVCELLPTDDVKMRNLAFFALFNYAIKGDTNPQVWMYIKKLKPSPWSVYDFLHLVKRERPKFQNDSIISKDQDVSIANLLEFLNGFALDF